MNAWADLETRLRSRYPDDWSERLQSYKDGSNQDLHRWRALGGIDAAPTASIAPSDRYQRIRFAAKTGVSRDLLAEHFGMTPSAISKVLARFGERATR